MFLAVKELLHGKVRFLLIGIIIVLIAWLVFLLSGLGNGLATLTASSFQNMKADFVMFEEGSRASMSRSVLPESNVSEIQNHPNVEAASPMGGTLTTVLKENASKGDKKIDVAMLGIVPGSFLEPEVIEGAALKLNEPMNAIANVSLIDEGYRLNDILEIDGSTEKVKIVGYVENQTYNHLPVIFITLDKWRALHFAAPGSDRGIVEPVNAIMLQGERINPEDINSAFPNTETVTKVAAIEGMPGYKEQNGTVSMMLAFLLTISAFVLGVFFYVLTLQKTNQFGIMKAMGASNAFLSKAIVSQVFILSLISIIIGIILTYGTAQILPEGMPFNLETKLVMIYALLLLAISIVSSLLSVRKITKIDPLQAIGRVE